jgi:SAM-dependent methyltransferase
MPNTPGALTGAAVCNRFSHAADATSIRATLTMHHSQEHARNGTYSYAGSELDLFSSVNNWKSYWTRHVCPFVTGDVLEVGAGIAANTCFLDSGQRGRWVCLEPDPHLCLRLTARLQERMPHRTYESVCGTIASLSPDEYFDTIMYIDVLEHIKDDRKELNIAASHLRPGGHLIVLSPAHQFLFTRFDRVIGHLRRYDRRALRRIAPKDIEIRKLIYLDSMGIIASVANLLFLRQSMPTSAQLRFWDRRLVPVSRMVDKLFHYTIGKSIVAVWRKHS